MFQIFPQNTRIPFMSMSLPCFVLSIIVMLVSLYFLATKGLNYGVDFAGGVVMVLEFPEGSEVSTESLRSELSKTEVSGLSVQRFGDEAGGREYMVHFAGDFADEDQMREKLKAAFGERTIAEFRLSGLEKAYISFEQSIEPDELRANLEKVDWGILNLDSVQRFGRPENNEFEVQFTNVSSQILGQLNQAFAPGESEVKLQKLEFVGAKVGDDLKTAALLSLIVATFLIFIYIFLRFDLTYAPGVVFAVVHDVLITAGIFSFLGVEFDLTVVAALLALAGYSINDTIVVYDRIRETRSLLKGKKLREVMDIAINQTMNRTVITSGTTLATTLALLLLGGPVIHGFALALCIGIIVGTYSSIFAASVLVLWMDEYRQRHSQAQKKRVAA